MRKLIAFIGAILPIFTLLAYWGRSGNEIKIYAADRDLRTVIDQMNYMVPQESITFRLVQNEDEADARIRFQDDLGAPNAAAVSFAYSGQIYISNFAPVDSLHKILFHEILHCAGVGHESEDEASIMYAYLQRADHIQTQHLRNLRRLSGITAPERLVAQIRVLL